MNRIRTIYRGFVFSLLLLGLWPVTAKADFQKEVTLDMTPGNTTSFTIYMPAEVLSLDNYTRWHTSPEDAAGKDEVYVRMEVAATSEIWLENRVRGTLKYELLDYSRNLIAQDIISPDNVYSANIICRGVFPAGTYYWRFYDYVDSDCVGLCEVPIRMDRVYAVEDDDRGGSNNTKAAAVKLEENTPARGYLSVLERDNEDWFCFDVEDASSVDVSVDCPGSGIHYELYNEAGSRISQGEQISSGSGGYQLPDGTYYIRLTPIAEGMDPPFYTGGSYSEIFCRGGSYSISCKQTKNLHLVPAESIIMEQTSVTLDTDVLGPFGSSKVEITARLLPENTTDEIIWSVGDSDLIGISSSQSNGNVYTCTIYPNNYPNNLEGGSSSVIARTSGESDLHAECEVIVNKFGSGQQGSGTGSGTGTAAHPDWHITFDNDEVSLAAGKKAYISYSWRGNDTLLWKSSDETVVSAAGWQIEGKSPGKAVVTAYFKNNPDIKAECHVTVTAPAQTGTNGSYSTYADDDGDSGAGTWADQAGRSVKAGSIFSNGSAAYEIQNNPNTVSYKGPLQTNVKSVKIPAEIKVDGKTYKVTSIAAKAFDGCKKLTKVTIGKNIISIGKKAFYGCGKLKKMTIQSKVLKKVGSKALKGTSKKLVVKVPAGMKKYYKKLLKSKGNKSITVK